MINKKQLVRILIDAEMRIDTLQFNYIGDRPKTDFDKEQKFKSDAIRAKLRQTIEEIEKSID